MKNMSNTTVWFPNVGGFTDEVFRKGCTIEAMQVINIDSQPELIIVYKDPKIKTFRTNVESLEFKGEFLFTVQYLGSVIEVYVLGRNIIGFPVREIRIPTSNWEASIQNVFTSGNGELLAALSNNRVVKVSTIIRVNKRLLAQHSCCTQGALIGILIGMKINSKWEIVVKKA